MARSSRPVEGGPNAVLVGVEGRVDGRAGLQIEIEDIATDPLGGAVGVADVDAVAMAGVDADGHRVDVGEDRLVPEADEARGRVGGVKRGIVGGFETGGARVAAKTL